MWTGGDLFAVHNLPFPGHSGLVFSHKGVVRSSDRKSIGYRRKTVQHRAREPDALFCVRFVTGPVSIGAAILDLPSFAQTSSVQSKIHVNNIQLRL